MSVPSTQFNDFATAFDVLEALENNNLDLKHVYGHECFSLGLSNPIESEQQAEAVCQFLTKLIRPYLAGASDEDPILFYGLDGEVIILTTISPKDNVDYAAVNQKVQALENSISIDAAVDYVPGLN